MVPLDKQTPWNNWTLSGVSTSAGATRHSFTNSPTEWGFSLLAISSLTTKLACIILYLSECGLVKATLLSIQTPWRVLSLSKHLCPCNSSSLVCFGLFSLTELATSVFPLTGRIFKQNIVFRWAICYYLQKLGLPWSHYKDLDLMTTQHPHNVPDSPDKRNQESIVDTYK